MNEYIETNEQINKRGKKSVDQNLLELQKNLLKRENLALFYFGQNYSNCDMKALKSSFILDFLSLSTGLLWYFVEDFFPSFSFQDFFFSIYSYWYMMENFLCQTVFFGVSTILISSLV